MWVLLTSRALPLGFYTEFNMFINMFSVIPVPRYLAYQGASAVRGTETRIMPSEVIFGRETFLSNDSKLAFLL